MARVKYQNTNIDTQVQYTIEKTYPMQIMLYILYKQAIYPISEVVSGRRKGGKYQYYTN